MGYWKEMKVDGYTFDICIDGVVMGREIDASDRAKLGFAAVVAVQVFQGIYEIVAALNSTFPITTADEARKLVKQCRDLERLAVARDFIAALSRQGMYVELPLDIYLVADAAALAYQSKPQTTRQFSVTRAGFVYLLRSASGFWKIGKTKNPQNRIETFSVKLPFEVEYEHLIPCADMSSAEIQLHQRFATKRTNGEWFALTDEDVAIIKSIQSL